ncbi:hypothetical protein ASD55_14825 [Rhodanobacter sp. Root561]|uniref:hypothetical protein n=1 Tax=Rhodanobacter sp. Root561 TaxID=1736560 RepID=UPI0006FD0A13|nr:hypothetical protein [Rhodanobacter sp. Root561]KQZ68323.1 hypothetical protein ASD55_14825 [Rhodanobacter sp. Root561]
MSKIGTALCLTYLLAILVCLGCAMAAHGDPKGQFVFAQIPIALQGSLAAGLGFGPALAGLSWPEAYLYLAGSTCCSMPLVGCSR